MGLAYLSRMINDFDPEQCSASSTCASRLCRPGVQLTCKGLVAKHLASSRTIKNTMYPSEWNGDRRPLEAPGHTCQHMAEDAPFSTSWMPLSSISTLIR